MATFISQSRSTYLSVLIITIVFAVQAFIRNRHTSIRKWTFTGIMIGAILLPLLLEVVLASPFGRIGVIEAVVGTDTFEENVLTRFLVIGSALEVLLDGGTSAIFGISHTAWDARFEQLGQLPVALHNHFLSNLVFYGFLGGTVSLVTFFAWPFFGVLTRQLRYGDKTSLVALLALFGGIVNLHFYEGFFSLILALELALLWCISRGLMLETRAMKLAS